MAGVLYTIDMIAGYLSFTTQHFGPQVKTGTNLSVSDREEPNAAMVVATFYYILDNILL